MVWNIQFVHAFILDEKHFSAKGKISRTKKKKKH